MTETEVAAAAISSSGHNWSKQDGPSVSKTAHPPEGTYLPSSAGDRQEVVRQANEVLGEMGRLKNEMKVVLTPEDSLRTAAPSSDHCQSQQKKPRSHHSGFQPSQSQKNQSHQIQSQPNPFQSQLSQSHSRKFQSHQSLFQEVQSKCHHMQQSQSMLVQKRPVVPSMLEEAGQVLRQVRRQKKVLDENLEALLRAKTGEMLHCQLDALAANRNWTQEVRIKKTVDSWINTFTKDIQAETSEDTAQSSAHPERRRKAADVLRGPRSKTAVGTGGRAQTAGHKVVQEAKSDRVAGVRKDGEQVTEESYLSRLYGRAAHEGLRRTLKRSPYLRFSSPASPLSRKPRPRLVESVRGVKVKSCKTQTCSAANLSRLPVGRHGHTFSSAHMTSVDPTDIQPVSVAIPLGCPRVESSSRCQHQQEVTSPPGASTAASVVAMEAEAPEQQSQKQPDAWDTKPSHTLDIIDRKSEEAEDEEGIFPGTDFQSVVDVVQEEVSAVGEEAVELDGGPSPPPVIYQGPLFPPRPPSALPAQDQGPMLDLDQRRDVLENRLVEWVEQQLMSRMISEMCFPLPSETAQNVSPEHSESENRSLTSDIVEAAGGGGLQLFVDSNIEVDSALIRQLVNEVLTETVSLMLGQKDALDTGPGLEPPKPGPAAAQEMKRVLLVPTPVPTPPPSPITCVRETTPLTTPSPSEPISQLNEETPHPITRQEHVVTPTSSPEPTPSAGSPPALLPPAWGDAELPLEEERPEEYLDSHNSPLLMSVAEEVPPLSSPHPPPHPSLPPAPSPPPPPPVPEPRPESVFSSSEDSSSCSSSNSSAVTEAVVKHISEGELLVSDNQQTALTEEEAACSFSSSLQELQDMEFDPLSEGQVRGQDLLLTLLPEIEQGVSHQGDRPQPEGSWGRESQEEMSVGEVRDDRTTDPYRTTNPRQSLSTRQDQSSSPGQISQCADMSQVSFDATNQGSITVDELMVEPLGTLTSDLQTSLSLSPLPPHLDNTHTTSQVFPIKLTHNHRQTEGQEEQQGGARRMDVHLPSVRPDQEEVMEESVSAGANTDSSTSDAF